MAIQLPLSLTQVTPTPPVPWYQMYIHMIIYWEYNARNVNQILPELVLSQYSIKPLFINHTSILLNAFWYDKDEPMFIERAGIGGWGWVGQCTGATKIYLRGKNKLKSSSVSTYLYIRTLKTKQNKTRCQYHLMEMASSLSITLANHSLQTWNLHRNKDFSHS